MKKMGFRLIGLVVTTLSLTWKACEGTSVLMEATPHFHDDVIPHAFNIGCRLSRRGSCAVSVVSMQVSKDGDTVIAGILRDDSIVYGRLLKASVMAEGHIDANPEDSFLSVTVKDAVREDSGVYFCSVSYLDESLRPKTIMASQNITITDQNTRDLVRHFLSKLSLMENLLHFQQNEYQRNYTALQSQMTAKDREQKEQIQALQARIGELVQVSRCPHDWKLYGDGASCIKGYIMDRTFSAARQICKGAGGDLVEVNSKAKNDFVRALFQGDAHVWIGLWDKHHRRHWRNMDGSSPVYTYWENGQPSGKSSSGHPEDCGHIYKGHGGKWNDADCDRSWYFACEMPVRLNVLQ